MPFYICIHTDLTSCDNELNQVTNCVCPGYSVVYECSVDGVGFTLWSGSLFNCSLSGNEIILSHSMFIDGVTKNCNDGNIIGESIQVNFSTYVSQLTILTYRPAFNGRNISCSLDNEGMTTIIGTAELMTSGIH